MTDPPTIHRADLGVDVPSALRTDFLSKLHYTSEDVASFRFVDGQTNKIEFSLKPSAASAPNEIGARIAELAQTMCSSFRGFSPKVLIQRSVASSRHADDPHFELERRGEIRRLGQGRYGLGPLLTRLMHGFDRTIVGLAEAFQAQHHQFPALIGGEVLERCRYLQSFPQSLTLVSHLREDLSLIERFATETRWTGTALHLNYETVAAPKCLLSPSVC